MNKNIVLIAVGSSLLAGCITAAVIAFRKRKRDLVESEDVQDETVAGDPDGDEPRYICVNDMDKRPEGDIPVRIVPDINKGASLSEIASKYRKADGEVVMQVIAKDEYEDIPYDDRHEAVYFVLDDILAGFDAEMNELERDSELFEVGVNSLMASDRQSVYLKDPVTGVGYEIIRSEDNYLDVYKEINGIFGYDMLVDTGEDDEEDKDD